MLALYRLHRRGAAGKGALEFFHVSKAGGTSMCELSVLNGCTASDTTLYGNCLMRRFNDGPRWVSHKEHAKVQPLPSMESLRWFHRYHSPRGNKPCGIRQAALTRNNITFFSNEFAVHGGVNSTRYLHVCRDTFNTILFREPAARLRSHIKWIMYVYRHVYQDGWEPFFLNRTAEWWYNFAPAVADNYYVRVLAGEHTFYLPRGAVPRSALEIAKLLVMQYDAVLQLEAADLNSHLRYGLGWVRAMDSIKTRHNRGGWGKVNAAMPPDLHNFQASGPLDAELYDFAGLLHQMDGFMYDVAAAAREEPLPSWEALLQESEGDLLNMEAIGGKASGGAAGRRSTKGSGKGKKRGLAVSLPGMAGPKGPMGQARGAATGVKLGPDGSRRLLRDGMVGSQRQRRVVTQADGPGDSGEAVLLEADVGMDSAGMEEADGYGGSPTDSFAGAESGGGGGAAEDAGAGAEGGADDGAGAGATQAPKSAFAKRLHCGYVGLSQAELDEVIKSTRAKSARPAAALSNSTLATVVQ